MKIRAIICGLLAIAAAVACQPEKMDETQKPGDETQDPGNNGEMPVLPTIDGKQWIAEVDGLEYLLDIGLYEQHGMVVALPAMDNSGFVLSMSGTYTSEAQDNTSGKIVFSQYDYEFDEFMTGIDVQYESLTETTVDITCVAIFGVETPVSCTAVTTPYEIDMDIYGGSGVQGEIEDGTYWIIEPNSQKVMTPLDETASSGNPVSEDAVDGTSTDANIFTFIYDENTTCYTIQDSYGRYLYADEASPRVISVSESFQNDTNYQWVVLDKQDGTYEIYNNSSFYSISYSPSSGTWEIYDSWAEDFANLLPALVKAE